VWNGEIFGDRDLHASFGICDGVYVDRGRVESEKEGVPSVMVSASSDNILDCMLQIDKCKVHTKISPDHGVP